MYGLSWPTAMLCASAKACWNRVVNLSKRMFESSLGSHLNCALRRLGSFADFQHPRLLQRRIEARDCCTYRSTLPLECSRRLSRFAMLTFQSASRARGTPCVPAAEVTPRAGAL